MGGRKNTTSSSKQPNNISTPASSTPSTLSDLLEETSLSNGSPSAATIIRCPKPTLTRLRSLRHEESLVLLTPVVPPPSGAPATAPMDPFEPFGRALAAHHKRIRHVPYVPIAGMTDTHLAFLKHAGAVAVVVCDVPNATHAKESRFEHQRAFAQAALNEMKKKEEEEESGIKATCPVMLVLVTGRLQWRVDAFDDFEAVFVSRSYAPTVLVQISDLMFGV